VRTEFQLLLHFVQYFIHFHDAAKFSTLKHVRLLYSH